MGVTTHGFWYPDPTTPSSLQGLLSAAATASEAALIKNNVIAGVPVAASPAALTALYTAQSATPAVGAIGAINGDIYWWTGSIWQNSDAVYSTVLTASTALATVTAVWKAHTYSSTTHYPTGGNLPGVGTGGGTGVTLTASGRYRCDVYGATSANVTGRRGVGVGTLANAAPSGLPLVIPAGSPGNVTPTYSAEFDFSAGDVICGYTYQDSGVNTVTVGSRGLSVERVQGI